MKIAIIGYSGSGKSTLAAYLGELYGVPVLHLDAVRFLPNWVERGPEEELAIVEDFMERSKESGWVIDGNFTSLLYERRMTEADRILFLSFSRFTCLHRILRRYRTYRGRVRPSSGKGCIEKIDLPFIKWVLFDGRTKERRTRYRRIGERYTEKFVTIKNQRALTAYMKKAKEESEGIV